MSLAEPPVEADMTRPIQGNSPPPPPHSQGPSNVAVVLVVLAFALVALVMLALGFVAGRSSGDNDDSGLQTVIVLENNTDATRAAENDERLRLATENALLNNQLLTVQGNAATADAALQAIGPTWQAANATISSINNNSNDTTAAINNLQGTITAQQATISALEGAATTAENPPALDNDGETAPASSTNGDGDTTEPIQGLLPGEFNTGPAPNSEYPYIVNIDGFQAQTFVDQCGRIMGQIIPLTEAGDLSYRVAWEHLPSGRQSNISTIGGSTGPGVFTINATTELGDGLFIIELYAASDDVLLAAPVYVRFPLDCAGYNLNIAFEQIAQP